MKNKINLKQGAFIQYRALGLTYQQIESELDISHKTAINWAKELGREIAEATEQNIITLNDNCQLSIIKTAQSLTSMLNRVGAELEKRDLSKVPTKDLLNLYCKHTALALDLAVRAEQKRTNDKPKRLFKVRFADDAIETTATPTEA